MSRLGLVALVCGVGFLAGCESSSAMRMELPASTVVVSAAPLEELTAAGGGTVGMGHLGTAIAWYSPSDRAIGNAGMVDINFNFNVSPNLSVELDAGWTKADVEKGAVLGDLQIIPISAGIQYGDRFGDIGRWYVGGGLGWSLNDLNDTGAGGETADNSLFGYVMGGMDVPLRDWLALCAELRYQLGNTDLSNGDTLGLDAFILRLNFVWLF